jgi:hypothetical protein
VTGWPSYTPRHLDFLFVAFYDSQGHGSGNLTRLHTGKEILIYFLFWISWQCCWPVSGVGSYCIAVCNKCEYCYSRCHAGPATRGRGVTSRNSSSYSTSNLTMEMKQKWHDLSSWGFELVMTVSSRTEPCLLPNQTFYIRDSKNACSERVSWPLIMCSPPVLPTISLALWQCSKFVVFFLVYKLFCSGISDVLYLKTKAA